MLHTFLPPAMFVTMFDPPIAFFFMVVGLPVVMFFSVPILLITTYHKRKMEEIRQRSQQQTAEQIAAEFASVREEIRQLRDTSMQYDLSFDNALQQMERRLAHIERQPRAQTTEETPQNLYTGIR